MRNTLMTITVLIVLNSCDHYSTMHVEKSSDRKIAIQQYFTSCAGLCGQNIIVDDLKGEQQSLLIMCNIESRGCRLCTAFWMGTQKSIANYNGKFVRKYSIFRPVYDTISLKKVYPNLDRGTYFDTLMLSRVFLPLTKTDSVLFTKALEFKSDTCKTNFIKFITGYILVSTREVNFKKEDFKSPK